MEFPSAVYAEAPALQLNGGLQAPNKPPNVSPSTTNYEPIPSQSLAPSLSSSSAAIFDSKLGNSELSLPVQYGSGCYPHEVCGKLQLGNVDPYGGGSPWPTTTHAFGPAACYNMGVRDVNGAYPMEASTEHRMGRLPYQLPAQCLPQPDVYSSIASNWGQYNCLTLDHTQPASSHLATYPPNVGYSSLEMASPLLMGQQNQLLAMPSLADHAVVDQQHLGSERCAGNGLLPIQPAHPDYMPPGLMASNFAGEAASLLLPFAKEQPYGSQAQLYSNQPQPLAVSDLPNSYQPDNAQPAGPILGAHSVDNALSQAAPLPLPSASAVTVNAKGGRRRAKGGTSAARLYPLAGKNVGQGGPGGVGPSTSSALPPPVVEDMGKVCGSVTGNGGAVMEAELGGGPDRQRRSGRSSGSRTNSDDDSHSNEDKETERRTANNTRERIRVRDINAAFKELAKLCAQHMPNTEERGLTKLGTLLKAVDLIPMLEAKVRARNLDPKCATSMVGFRERDDSEPGVGSIQAQPSCSSN